MQTGKGYQAQDNTCNVFLQVGSFNFQVQRTQVNWPHNFLQVEAITTLNFDVRGALIQLLLFTMLVVLYYVCNEG
jgi:hypothetical protein